MTAVRDLKPGDVVEIETGYAVAVVGVSPVFCDRKYRIVDYRTEAGEVATTVLPAIATVRIVKRAAA